MILSAQSPRIGFLAILLGLVVCADLASADELPPLPKIGVTGTDDRVRVDSKTWPWIAIGRINLEGRGHCTGTLIAPDLVLTAAHCLYNAADGRWGIPLETHFVAGYDRGTYAAHSRGKKFVLDPAYDPKAIRKPETAEREMARDWVIVQLAKPLDIKPVPLADVDWPRLAQAGEAGHVTNAGYSSDWPEIAMRDTACRALGMRKKYQVLLHKCDATFGASGGPLLLMDGGAVSVVGLQSGELEFKGAPDSVNTAVPVWTFRDKVPR